MVIRCGLSGTNGQLVKGDSADVLRWAGRVVTADDLYRSLNGHRELVLTPRAVVTPLAAEHLRARGVRVSRQDAAAEKETKEKTDEKKEGATPVSA